MSDAPEEIIELAEADRVAAPLLLRMGNGCRAPDRAGLPYACSYRSASRDRDLIRDADMAKEMTSYTKSNVLMQSAQSMLAQANQNSSSVLSLLQ